MEREIKFKAWSKATEKMTEWEFIKSVRNFEKLLTLDHVVVLQFTGLNQGVYTAGELVRTVKTDNINELNQNSQYEFTATEVK